METVVATERERTAASGSVALAFVNTRSGPADSGSFDRDVLSDYGALVAWCEHAGVLDADAADALRRRARRNGTAAAAAFASALAVRDDVDAIMRSVERGNPPPAAPLRRLRERESEGLARARLVPQADAGPFAWDWAEDESLERPVHVLVHEAIGLLTGGPLTRLKQCAGCSFLFLDESKNRSRRWCSMADCGTAEKMRRYVNARRERRSAS